MENEILELQGPCRDYLWGGTRLKDEYNAVSDKTPIAECWELSARKDASCVILNGIFAGKTFYEYIKETNGATLGTECNGIDFPLLIKLIDAKENLSVQVHPDDVYAKFHENENGKTEMWYILDCEPDAEIIYGFKNEITREEFEASIENNTLMNFLYHVKVKKGRVYYIPSGTVHAIGKGILLAEIQENSDTTYRVYDYNRKDKNGKLRELNIEKALDVAKTAPAPDVSHAGVHMTEDFLSFRREILCRCEYFNVQFIQNIEESEFEPNGRSFRHILVTDGVGKIRGFGINTELRKGSSIFVPANTDRYIIDGQVSFIATEV